MRVGNVKEIVFSKDPKQMNWLREDFPYAEVKCPNCMCDTSFVVQCNFIIQPKKEKTSKNLLKI